MCIRDRDQGFEVVEYRIVTADTLDEAMDYFADAVEKNIFPSDGLVALYDDIAYGESLGSTTKFPRNAFAFKWADEIRETTLRSIESVSYTHLPPVPAFLHLKTLTVQFLFLFPDLIPPSCRLYCNQSLSPAARYNNKH